MSKEIYISSTPHETRLAIVENDALTEIYYERENEYTLAGSIYNGKVTRVLPGMQSSFVDIGLERDAFLYITDFMEEAGDAADFESNANAGDSGRPRNGDRGGRGGRDRNDRGDREQQPRLAEPRYAEPSDSELFTQAVSGLDPARPVIEGERSDRSGDRDRGRRGGRNRGGRSGNREGGRPDGNRTDGNRTDEVRPVPAEPIAGNIAIPDNHDEVGEGLPGADGSRRWRGRRGRRGNRAPDTDVPQTAPQTVAADQPVRNSATGPVYDAYPGSSPDIYGADESSESEPEERFEIEGAAATLPTPTEQAAFQERAGSSDRGERNDRGPRNDRGGRGGRDRNRGGDRGDRGAQAPPRAPRGFAPSAELYKVDKGEPRYGSEPEIEAPIEPIILPGESLGKYRNGGEAASTSPAAPSAAVPSAAPSEFVAEGWDGGFVLPGETLRPRNNPPAARNDAPRESRDSRGRGGDRDGRDRNRGDRNDRGDRNRSDRNDRGPRESRPAFERPAPAATAEPVHYEAAEPTHLTQPEEVPASHLVTPINSTFVPPPPKPFEAEPAVAHEVVEAPAMIETPESVAPPQEYEPSEASASYRIDPVPPSEFRQSAPVIEEPVAAEPIAAEPEFVAAADVPAEPHQEHVETPVETHELTAISDTGNMHSEPAATSHHELPAQEEPAPASPIAHEGAVVDAAPVAPQPMQPYFEPGSGHLEEEMLDDEEDAGTLPTVHAHTAADFDQQEQETLENAADLGTMIREMSIDQITRTEPAIDEDDEDEDDEEDFEEDFLEEDQDFDSEESEPEDEEDAEEVGDDAPYAEAEAGEFGEGASAEVAPRSEGATYAQPSDAAREPRRDGRGNDRGRRDGRGRDRDRNRRPGSGDRDRSASSDRGSDRGSDRSSGGDRGRRDGGRGRQSMQSTNLPAISDLLKPGQEILVQIAKEPIAKKGARITSHIALPGRFLVFMPTVSHTGVSRKIESDGERRRLKDILLSEKGDAQGGFIVRTAAAGASEEELRSDLRFLLNLWSDIKTRSESSKSPALIYHDLNLIERVLRDQVTDTFSAIWVDTETEYERVLRFLQRFQPSLIRRVKLYTKEVPLFEQFGITEEINKALRSKVWLKSGGSIVINQTEALVAIDINTGKFVGKTARLEDTIVKTNLDAIPEIVRQIRLRDLGGIIIIDFIDMDERKNRNKVMAALEEELKSDRAPSKVLQFNDFGLVAITRKRVKQSLERTLSTTCGVCQGTGMVKSPVTVCNDIYVEMRKMAKHLDRGDVMLRVHPEVVKQLKASSTHWLQEMEEMVGKTILVKSDPSLHPEQFDIH
jgi:ribonuclease E